MHPETIEIEGVVYEISVTKNNDEIQYFNLSKIDDESDDLFFECDWSGDFTENDILQLLKEDKKREEINSLTLTNSSQEETTEIKSKTISPLHWMSHEDLIKCYPYLSDISKEDLTELIESLYSLRHESQSFMDITVDEWLETYEELRDGSNPYL